MYIRISSSVKRFFCGSLFLLLALGVVPLRSLSAPAVADSLWTFQEALVDSNSDGALDYEGRKVVIGGIANTGSKQINTRDLHAFIQNEDYGIGVFGKRFAQPFRIGDSVVVTGELQTYDGLHEVRLGSYEVFPGVDRKLVPKTIAQIKDKPERYLSMLVEGEGNVISKGSMDNGKYLGVTFSEKASRTYRIYVSNFHARFSEFDLDVLSVGDRVKVTGVLSVYDPPQQERVYQIHLRKPADLKYSWIPQYYFLILLIAAAILIAGTAGWIVTLRKKVGSKTEEIRRSLDEKKVLLQEIHHRVKNNLSIISGLIGLQLESTDDEVARSVLKDSQSRIQSMAMVHDKLYKTDSLSDIRLDTYLKELVEEIGNTFTEYRDAVELKFDLEPVEFNIDKIIPCGLLVNELVVNAFKHAFKKGREGILEVGVDSSDGMVQITVADNGPGLPDNFELGAGDSLGALLINTFSAQLEAETKFGESRYGGTRFSFKIPAESSE